MLPMERSLRVRERDVDTAAVGAHVQSVLADALQRWDPPVEVVVRVERDRIALRIFPSAAPDATLGSTVSFAVWFRERLRDRSLTQGAAARMLGVSAKTINRWARGDTEPRFRELVMLYERLGESPFLPRLPPLGPGPDR